MTVPFDKCYARHLGHCDAKSREHFISKAILEDLAPFGIQGLPWLKPGEIEPASLTNGVAKFTTPSARSDFEGVCFDAEELVFVEGMGQVEIQFVGPGLRVLSRCEKTGETAYRDVLQQFCRESVPTYHVWVGGYQPIETTAEHPFWVKGKGWVPVIELQHGDVLENSRGTEITVWKVVPTNRVNTVYNLEVEGFNTYFVGVGGVWVHNCNLKIRS